MQIRPIPAILTISILILFSTSFAWAQIYLNEVDRARKVRFESEVLLVEQLELGELKPGTNQFKMRVTNKSNEQQSLVLYLQARPGLAAPEERTKKSLHLEPAKTEEISCAYRFPSLSPFGKLVIRITDEEQQDAVLFEDRFHVGAENPNNHFDLSKFGKISGPHLTLYYLPGTLAASDSRQILSQREEGISKIEKLIGATFQGKIDLFLYPDLETKKADTLHTGEGWAFDGIMVEVYNSSIQLDPFHEMTHIIMNQLGSPPAMFDEGFAVYAAESLGADSLKYLGGQGRKIDEVTRDLKEKGKLLSLSTLLSISNIGDTPEAAAVQYPQSASVVSFIINRYGTGTFRTIFSSLQTGSEPEVVRKNIAQIEKITGKTLQDLENAWLETLTGKKSLKESSMSER